MIKTHIKEEANTAFTAEADRTDRSCQLLWRLVAVQRLPVACCCNCTDVDNALVSKSLL